VDIKNYRDLIILAESPREKLVQEPLPYGRDDLAPVMSKDSIDYHYGKLASSYVDRYNKKEGDDQFNRGGAALHNLFFPQLIPPRSGNRPTGISKDVIDAKWGSFDKFKDAWALEFMKAQGSNWIYMDSRANIKVIHNHEHNRSMDIVMIMDGWEHSWILDYKHDKQRYEENFWRIVDWNVVNDRLQGEGDD
jgi:Fe-Mn family superoxide dismutase